MQPLSIDHSPPECGQKTGRALFQFETVKPPSVTANPGVSAQDHTPLTHRALLAWAEHCIECAPPECYVSCDLFDATPNLKCRRFTDGIVPLGAPGRAPAAEVRFRKWAKLEAQGSATMLASGRVDRYEALLTRLGGPLNRLGLFVHRLGGDGRWLTAVEALHKRINRQLEGRRAASPRPNVFIADIVNPGGEAVALTLTVAVDKLRLHRQLRADQLPFPAISRLEVPPGASHHAIDIAPMRAIFESGLPFTIAISPENDAGAHLIFERLDLGIAPARTAAALAEASTKPAGPAKLVIFDLDNTLWQGVLLEGDVRPVEGLKQLFDRLDRRGILLSVASKNAREDAMRRLEEIGIAEYLLYPQIGWQPKSESVQHIIRAIDIGADTVMFIDDNPFEREEVAGAVAGVAVMPETALVGLADHPRLQGTETAEARGRRRMYQEAAEREDAASAFGDDYVEFLRSCEIEVAIRKDRPDDFERVSELVQRTNQLNFSGRKYSREDTAALLANPDQERHVVVCRDRFGSYGTVGFCLVHRESARDGADELVVDDFMLSCRVQGKFVEQALLNHLADNGPRPVASIRVNFKQTARNRAAQMVLEKLAFALDERSSAYRKFHARGDLAVDFMTVVTD
jgi:FkbH-like protein